MWYHLWLDLCDAVRTGTPPCGTHCLTARRHSCHTNACWRRDWHARCTVLQPQRIKLPSEHCSECKGAPVCLQARVLPSCTGSLTAAHVAHLPARSTGNWACICTCANYRLPFRSRLCVARRTTFFPRSMWPPCGLTRLTAAQCRPTARCEQSSSRTWATRRRCCSRALRRNPLQARRWHRWAGGGGWLRLLGVVLGLAWLARGL